MDRTVAVARTNWGEGPAETDLPRVAVQVVLYHSSTWIPKLVRALELLDYPQDRFEVRLFNNTPGDGSRELLDGLHTSLTLSCLDSPDGNIGFGRAHNRLAALPGDDDDFLLLLNPDTIPFYDCLRRLVDRARLSPGAALIEATQFPIEHPKTYDLESGLTNWCSAACLLVSAPVFRGLGGFDERIFLYCEDVDLSWRCWLAGYACVYEPAARCVHVTRDSDLARDRSPELFHSHIGNLYLRQKYFGDEAVREYSEALRGNPDADLAARALAAFEDIRPETVGGSHPRIRIMPDHNYAPVRW